MPVLGDFGTFRRGINTKKIIEKCEHHIICGCCGVAIHTNNIPEKCPGCNAKLDTYQIMERFKRVNKNE